MSSTHPPRNDPDPEWHMRPLPGPGPALTAEEQVELAAYHDYVDSMQMNDIDGRTESDPYWAAPAWPTARMTWEADRQPENEPEIEAGS